MTQSDKIAEAGWTPGPWFVETPLGNGPGDHLWIVQEGATAEVYDWRNLAVVCSDDPEDCENSRPITVAERDANARLIAAAPELAEAVASFLPSHVAFDHPGIPDDDVVPLEVTMGELRRLRAALSKATGEGEG